MGNLLVNRRDQQFLLYEQFGVDRLFEKKKFAEFSRDIAEMMLNEAEKLAVNDIVTTYQKGDQEGCRLKDGNVYVPSCYHDAYRKYIDGGWLSLTTDQKSGGQGAPLSIGNACKEYFCASNYALMMYPGLARGAAALIESYGTEEQKNKYMFKMFSGEWGGTMCLTEPGAGTDVGALKTKAIRRPDGTFNIVGTKCFISGGDHDLVANIIHPVLARIDGDPPGTSGISIFLVPKIRVGVDGSLLEFNDVRVGNIEHKMGIKGSATCTLNFGDEGNCVGELLGNEREGLKIMFQMMNEARIGVGMQGLGHASAAYEHALQYAKERIQSAPIWEMRNPNAKAVSIIQHPYVRRTLLWMKCYVEGLRALNYYTAFSLDMSRVSETPEDKETWHGMVELLTPLCKAFSSDKAVEVCLKAMDVHGGYGYCSEYPVEQYLRDSKIASIYEGTNGIQALDLVGRKLGQRKGANVAALSEEIRRTVQELEQMNDLASHGLLLGEAAEAWVNLTAKFGELSRSKELLTPLLNATPYLEIMGDVVVGWLLLQGAGIASGKLGSLYSCAEKEMTEAQKEAAIRENGDIAYYCGKIAAAKFFAVNVLTAVKARCEAIATGDKTSLLIAEESFSQS